MTILEKLKTPVAAILAVFFVAALFLVIKIKKLHDNLKVNTHITQDLKHHLDEVAKEDEETKQKLKESQTEVENLNSTLKNLKEENVTAGQRQEALQKLIDDCDKMLRSQNQKIDELEKKLRESQTKLAQQKRQRDAYAEESRNPAATRAYAKLMESEWLNAMAKTDEFKKDLNKTLRELSAQNKERSRIQKETATMHYNLAVILTNQHNFPAAIQEYEKVVSLNPNDADAHYNLAIIYDSEIKDNDKALEHYREYIRIAPDAKESQEVREWIHNKEVQNSMRFEKVQKVQT